jgi:signal recognition particle subunit SRP54
MGNITKILEMIPKTAGMPKLDSPEQMEKELRSTEAIISSMTVFERGNPDIINGSRRKRIAKGSGTTVADVNRFLKKFFDAKKMFKAVSMGSGSRGWKNPLKQIFSSM